VWCRSSFALRGHSVLRDELWRMLVRVWSKQCLTTPAAMEQWHAVYIHVTATLTEVLWHPKVARRADATTSSTSSSSSSSSSTSTQHIRRVRKGKGRGSIEQRGSRMGGRDGRKDGPRWNTMTDLETIAKEAAELHLKVEEKKENASPPSPTSPRLPLWTTHFSKKSTSSPSCGPTPPCPPAPFP
jgi:hypothetical protein